MGSHEPFEPLLELACYVEWSPDGSKLAYTQKYDMKGLPNRLIIANVDGSNPVSLFEKISPNPLAHPT
jgi:hypothetical protein